MSTLELLQIFHYGRNNSYKCLQTLTHNLDPNSTQERIFSLTLKNKNSHSILSVFNFQTDNFNTRRECLFILEPWPFHTFWPAKGLMGFPVFITENVHGIYRVLTAHGLCKAYTRFLNCVVIFTCNNLPLEDLI